MNFSIWRLFHVLLFIMNPNTIASNILLFLSLNLTDIGRYIVKLVYFHTRGRCATICVVEFTVVGHTCFLVRDVPQYALAAHVEVVCEDGDCFGCVPRSGGEERRRQQRPRTLEEMMGLGYTCVLTRFAATFVNFFIKIILLQ